MELYNSLINDARAQLEGLSAKVWDYSPADCWAHVGSSELVDKDQVILYGPDMGQIKGDCDFARIVLLRVGVLDDDDEAVYRTLKDIEFAKYHVYPEGYMVRMSPESSREQVRVSKKALGKGISFRSIGASYVAEYKKDANVLNATVIFITDPKADYAALQAAAKKASAVTGTLTHILEGLPTDCSICALKDICDEVEGMKELHFGVGDKSAKH